MLRNFVRLIFGQEILAPEKESPLEPSAAPRAAVDRAELPDISAACWRHVILGRSELATGNVPLQFLLKNNLRFVKRAQDAEEVVAERIRITRNFFIQNQRLLGQEIQALSQLEAEGSR